MFLRLRQIYKFSNSNQFPLDINLFRDPSGIQKLRQSAKKRYKDPLLIDQVIELQAKHRQQLYKYEQKRKEINSKNKQLKQLYMKKLDQQKVIVNKQLDVLRQQSQISQNQVDKLYQKLKELIVQVGNIVDEEVKVDNNEDNNIVYNEWGKTVKGKVPYWDILQKKLDAVDMKRGSKVAGHRGYYLKGPGVRLALALIQYGINFLQKQGYTLYQTPVTIKEQLMRACCQLSSIEQDVYTLKDQNLMLIATSEQPLASLFSGQVFQNLNQPLKLGGYSLCFRKQAGAAGKDNQGIFRVHQFQKLQQFVICDQASSKQFQYKMLQTSKRFYESLQIPYRVVQIVSGALNDAATRKFDLQGWFPAANKYRQLVSVSNCTDYQSRMLDIKYRDKKQTKYVHMLNGTLCAVQRSICALVQNHWDEKQGVKLPKALSQYYGSDNISNKQ